MLMLMLSLPDGAAAQLQPVGLVLAVVPMGMIGVVGALLLVGNRPLGFVAILGILALLGMIARNAVLLIEQIEIERKCRARKPWDAVIAATMSRFRPIMLTAISTVLGMIPIAGDGVLGADGRHDHGRPVRGDAADADLPAGALSDGVPHLGAVARRAATTWPRWRTS